eukprot:Gb_28095 [translate_table: standard]
MTSPCTMRLPSSMSLCRTPSCSLPRVSLKSSFTGNASGRIHLAPKRVTIQTHSNGRMQIRCEEVPKVDFETRKKEQMQQLMQQLAIPEEHRDLYEAIEKIGPDLWKKTWYPKAADHENAKKKWYIVDATDKVLGRLASTIAIHIRGKNLPTYTPSVDMGAYVIVVNAEKVAVSGKKRAQKLYRRHSGRPGGLKVETFDQLQKRIPERIVEHAVRGMLPKGRLGKTLFTHLKVFKGPDHIHEAQKPEPLPIHDKRIMIRR